MVIHAVVAFVVLTVLFNQSVAVPCSFKYETCDHQNRQEISLEKYGLTEKIRESRPDGLFKCDENDDEFISENTNWTDPQFIFSNPESDDTYEDIESTCEVSRRTIQPQALNNIYNELIRVVNTASFVQFITIEQCLNKKEPCNGGTNPPRGKKHICRQKHVQITLKAFKNNSNVIADEQFYYPSHCVCELVTVKKKDSSKQKKCMPFHPTES